MGTSAMAGREGRRREGRMEEEQLHRRKNTNSVIDTVTV